MRPPILLILVLLACHAEAAPAERLVGGPCDGCDIAFEGMPAKLAPKARIASTSEPGEPMTIDGVVTRGGKPAAGVIVYAYHTNAAGTYPPGKTRHGSLRGWAITAKDGTYQFQTIRPASYPNTPVPQHVHVHVIERGKCHYYIDDLLFTDDPLLTPVMRKAHDQGRGGRGIATPSRDKDKTWRVRRDIALGAGIRDYARCK